MSKDLLETAFGESVRKTLAAIRASAVGAPDVEAAAGISRGVRDAMRDLCGSPGSGGQLQVKLCQRCKMFFFVTLR